jgi:hypothetical protein
METETNSFSYRCLSGWQWLLILTENGHLLSGFGHPSAFGRVAVANSITRSLPPTRSSPNPRRSSKNIAERGRTVPMDADSTEKAARAPRVGDPWVNRVRLIRGPGLYLVRRIAQPTPTSARMLHKRPASEEARRSTPLETVGRGLAERDACGLTHRCALAGVSAEAEAGIHGSPDPWKFKVLGRRRETIDSSPRVRTGADSTR